MVDKELPLGAVVLAAGSAKRMGRSKLDMPWPLGGTVLGRVLDVLHEGGVDKCIVVTGWHRQAIEEIVLDREVESIFNPDYAGDDMLTSVRVGLAALEKTSVAAALIMPADHPLIQPETIRSLTTAWRKVPDRIWIPSHDQRRGHPVLLPRIIWSALASETGRYGLRSYLSQEADLIEHLSVPDPGIRMDIDDPAAYQRFKDLVEQ